MSYLYVSWFFRDGMGPDSTSSAGLEALSRVKDAITVSVGGWLLVNGISLFRYRLRRKRAA